MKPKLTRLALALLPLLHAGHAQTATVTWVGRDGGTWGQFNWSGNARPTAVDDVLLGGFNTNVLSIELARSVTGTGTLSIHVFTAPLIFDAGLTLTGDSSLGGMEMGGGYFRSSANTAISGSLTWNDGSILGSGTTRVEGSAVLSLSMRPNLMDGHTLVLRGNTVARTSDPFASVNALGIENARLVNEGTWLDQASRNISFMNPNRPLGLGHFDNLGSFTKQTATVTTIESGVLFHNSGTVDLNAGTMRLAGDFNNQGLINIASGAELDGAHVSFANAGTLAGSGTVRALDTLTNSGILTPGGVGQVGQLQVLGNLATNGNLQVDLGHNGADLLAVSGTATLGGTLSFAVLGGERLQRGSSFNVMSWGERSGSSEFASLNFSQASGHRFSTTYGPNGLSVTVTGLPYTWTGAATGGFWDVVSNWNNGADGRPQVGDAVLLGSADTRIRSIFSVADVTGTGMLALDFGANLTVSDGGSLGALSMLQGQLTHNGRLVVTGAATWVNTQLRGSGTTRLEGTTTIAGTDFDTTPILRGGHTLELAGTTLFRHRRGLSVAEGATLINQGTWVDESPANVTVANVNGGTGRILNLGTFTKASATRTLIGEGTQLVFDNTGTLNVDAGYLRLSSSTVSSTGTVNIAAGAELSVASRDATLGGTVRNAGMLSLDSGVLAIAGDLDVQGNGLTRVASIVSNTNRLTFDGSVDWTVGTFTGSGSTRMNGAVTLSGANGRTLSNGQTLELAGTTTQVGTGGLNTGGGARVLNLGSWVDAANGNVTLGNLSTGANINSRFDNVGSFTKTSTAVTEIGSRLNFHNTGTLDIQAGTLRISDDATLMAGEVRIGSGGTLTAGQVRIANGATLSLAAGSIALGGTVQNAGTLALAGATVVVADSATVQGGLTTFRGAVANTGALQINGHVDWFEGDLRGSGTTRIDGTLALRGGNTRQLRNGQTLELSGTTTQIGTGGFQTGQGARLVNLGQWVDAANGNVGMINFNPTSAPGSRFDNVGTFTKTSAFTTTIGNGLVFNNTGTLDLQAGTLKFSERFDNQGLIRLAAGAELASEVATFANAGTLAGDGTVRTSFVFTSLSNSGTLAAGGLDDAGTMNFLGGLTQGASGIFLVDLGSTAAGGFDLLTISGTAALNGTLAVNLLDGAQFNVGDSFTVMTWNQRQGNSQFASLDLSQAEGYTFAAEYGANSLTLRVVTAPVPEPESWALMALGLVGMAAWARRRAGGSRAA